MPAITIPNQSPAGWTPGTSVGIIGGIEQYLPGGSHQCTTLHNVVTDMSADNTGASDVLPSITLSSVGTNEVLYFPYGLYRFDSGLNCGTKAFTIRGAGEGVVSTSSVTIGTGTKVFTRSGRAGMDGRHRDSGLARSAAL